MFEVEALARPAVELVSDGVALLLSQPSVLPCVRGGRPLSYRVGRVNRMGQAPFRSEPDNVKPQGPLPAFTEKQGQYLAFIYYYTKVNGQARSEADMQRYFRVTPPSVHQMIVTLERQGFITRVLGRGRSITLCFIRAAASRIGVMHMPDRALQPTGRDNPQFFHVFVAAGR